MPSSKSARRFRPWQALTSCVLALAFVGQAQAQVRYDLYRGTGYIPGGITLTTPNFKNDVTLSGGAYDTATNINNLIALAAQPSSSALSGMSDQANYPQGTYLLCDRNAYNTTTGTSVASCQNQYQGYIGYTMIYLPDAGTYSLGVGADDGTKIDYAVLTPEQAAATAGNYTTAVNYSSSTGMLRSPTTNNSFLTVKGPAYIALRMYWVNWGNTNSYTVSWKTPTNPTPTPVPPSNTCDPKNPVAACFPQFSISKTGPAYVKPSVAASANPITSAASNYLTPYTITVTVNPSSTGNTTTYGTTTITDTLPSALSWVPGTSSYTAPTGWTCTVVSSTITCTTSSVITATNTYTFTLNNLLVATGTAAGTEIANTASVVTAYTDSSGTTNLYTPLTSTAKTKTILSTLVKTVSKTAAYPGDTLTYCLTATNQGGADLNSYTISDYAPAQLQDITNITFANNGVDVAGSTYDASQTTNPATGVASSGLVASPAVTLASGTSAVLCFDSTVQ